MGLNIGMDLEVLERGEWSEHPTFDGVEVCVKATEAPSFKERHREVLNRMTLVDPGLGDSIEASRMAEIRASADLLTDWKGVDDEHGKEMPFSLEKARSLAQDRRYEVFFSGVLKRAKQRTTALTQKAPKPEERLGN